MMFKCNLNCYNFSNGCRKYYILAQSEIYSHEYVVAHVKPIHGLVLGSSQLCSIIPVFNSGQNKKFTGSKDAAHSLYPVPVKS